MPLTRTCVTLLAAMGAIQAQQITIVSGASYQKRVAPNSLASVFGAGLSSTTASAQLDSNGQLPTRLAGVTVEMNGLAGPLIFVSPAQINLLVPADVGIGTANVIVRSTNTAATQSGAVEVANIAPALFSLDSSGSGPGAILNAVTYNGGPFFVETQENPVNDKRTRLAVYGTGLRYAGNPTLDPAVTTVISSVQAQGRSASGKTFQLPVEFVGPAPGFFGLDQVNLVLPPEADLSGTIALTVSVDSFPANSVTFTMNSLLTSQIHIANLTLAQTVAIGINDIPGTIALNAPARLGGYPVTLLSDVPAIQLIPPSLTIPEGQVSQQFTVHTNAVTVGQAGAVTAFGQNGESRLVNVEVVPANGPMLVSLALNPATVAGGRSVAATVTLSAPAPATGTVVQLSSDNTTAKPPASVTVPAAQRSVAFEVTTSAVTSPQAATISATLSGTTKSARLTINPPVAITLSTNTVTGGVTVMGTVTLATQAPAGGASVSLRSSDAVAMVPVIGVTIPAGQTTASFSINTVTVSSVRTVTISASYAGDTGSATLTVNPPGAATLAALTLNPTTVAGGANVTGTVTLTDVAPVLGINVQLRSSSLFAQVPVSVMVPAGVASANFIIATVHPATGAQTAAITAAYQSVSKTATLTIQ